MIIIAPAESGAMSVILIKKIGRLYEAEVDVFLTAGVNDLLTFTVSV